MNRSAEFSPIARSFPARQLTNIGLALLGLLLLFFAVRGLLPDPSANLFFKAQRLEGAGQLELALRHYTLLTSSHPESSYAPRALERQGNILTGLARRSGNAKLFAQALETYTRLAETYPENSLAGEALLTAGNIAFTDLRDWAGAQRIYTAVLNRYANNREFASEATLRLGRIALAQKSGPAAQTWFQRVLQQFPTQAERCAEAQYHLGVTYETLFKNRDHMEMAKRAFEATWKRYPQSLWASNAKERLGLLYYVDLNKPQERRVFIEVPPLPDESTLGTNPKSPLAALRILLAARGVETDETILRGWSLTPFYAALDPNNPARVITAPFDQLTNILANAGLRYKPVSGGAADVALKDLQNELDEARPPLVFTNRWQLAVGYDSRRGEVFLQGSGTRLETFAVKDFSAQWKAPSPIGGPFTMLTVFRPDEQPKPRQTNRALPLPKAKATPIRSIEEAAPRPTPSPTPIASLSTPTWVFEAKPVFARDAHRATLRRAAQWMKRSRDGGALLNLEALNTLAREFERLSQASTSILPAAEATPLDESTSDTIPEAEKPLGETNIEATPTATPTVQVENARAPQTNVLARTQALLGWFQGNKAPLQLWLTARRDAAAYLDVAANALNNRNLQTAAREFRRSIEALENAASVLPAPNALSDDESTLNDAARRALKSAARDLRSARDAENRALIAMSRL